MSVVTLWDPDLWQPGRFTVVLGMRRSGKTWLLRSLLERVIHPGNRRDDGCSWSSVEIYSSNPDDNRWRSMPCKGSGKLLLDLAEGRYWSSFGQRAQLVQSKQEQQMLARLAASTPLCQDAVVLVGAYAGEAVRSLVVVDDHRWEHQHFQGLGKHRDSPWAKPERCAAAAWLSIRGVYQLPFHVFQQCVDTLFILDDHHADDNQFRGIFRRMRVQEDFGLSEEEFRRLLTERAHGPNYNTVVVLDRRTRVPAVFANLGQSSLHDRYCLPA